MSGMLCTLLPGSHPTAPPPFCFPSPPGGLSFRATLLLANVTTAAWLAVYHLLLDPPEARVQQLWRHDSDAAEVGSDGGGGAAAGVGARRHDGATLVVEAAAEVVAQREEDGGRDGGEGDRREQQRLLRVEAPLGSAQQQAVGGWSSPKPSRAARMTWRERLQRTGETAGEWGWRVPAPVHSPSAPAGVLRCT